MIWCEKYGHRFLSYPLACSSVNSIRQQLTKGPQSCAASRLLSFNISPAQSPIISGPLEKFDLKTRVPLSIQSFYYAPLRREGSHGLPVCDLQLRSFGIRNLEFMTDFALRSAYYLNLAAKGPVPLPKDVQRWTVIKGPFVHKKSKENFERVTYKRLVQIQDGSLKAVELWLAFLREHEIYGVGMKANVYKFETLPVYTFPGSKEN